MSEPVSPDWVRALATGDDRAVELVFSRYFRKLVQAASKKLVGINRAVRNEEDIALSAMKSFCLGVRENRYLFETEDDLWGFLFLIVNRKATAERRRNLSQKRGGGCFTFSGHDAFTNGVEEESQDTMISQLESEEPSPEAITSMAEEVENFIATCSADEISSQIIKLKLEGDTVPEISAKLGLVPHTIFYHLRKIKERWTLSKTCCSLVELKAANISDEEAAEELGDTVEKIQFLWKIIEESLQKEGLPNDTVFLRRHLERIKVQIRRNWLNYIVSSQEKYLRQKNKN